MKFFKLLFIVPLFFALSSFGQKSVADLLTQANIIRNAGAQQNTREVVATMFDQESKSNVNLLAFYTNPSWINSLSWGKITSTPTSMTGYGITTGLNTVNGQSLFGNSNLVLTSVWGGITGTLSDQTDLQTALSGKQSTLVSGTNIKTINSTSLLGSGNIVISGGGGITNSAVNNELAMSDGTNLVSSKVYGDGAAGLALGDGSQSGPTRTMQAFGSGTNLDIVFTPKGSGTVKSPSLTLTSTPTRNDTAAYTLTYHPSTGAIQRRSISSIGGSGGVSTLTQIVSPAFISGSNINIPDAKPLTGQYFLRKYITFLGDSYFAGSGASTHAMSATALVCKSVGAVEDNQGVAGSTIEKRVPVDYQGASNFVDRASTAIPTKDASHSLLVIAGGLNDMGYVGANYTTANYITDYTTVIGTAFSKGWDPSQIVLVGPYWIGTAGYAVYATITSQPAPTKARHLSFDAATKTVAINTGVRYLSMYDKQLKNDTTLIGTDHIHPTDPGHEFISQCIVEFIGGLGFSGTLTTTGIQYNNYTGTGRSGSIVPINNADHIYNIAHYASVANSSTFLSLIPNGTGYGSGVSYTNMSLFNSDYTSDQTNFGVVQHRADATSFSIQTNAAGTSTLMPLILWTGTNTNQLNLATSGKIGIGGDPIEQFHVFGGNNGEISSMTENTSSGTSAYVMDQLKVNGTTIGYFGAFSDVYSTAALQKSVVINNTSGGDTQFYMGGTPMGRFTNAGDFVVGASVSSFNIKVTQAGTITANGNLVLNTAGNTISIASGSNASKGTGTLSGGTATISTSVCTSSSTVLLSDTNTSITNVGSLTVVAGSGSFVVSSTNVLDASTFKWVIIN